MSIKIVHKTFLARTILFLVHLIGTCTSFALVPASLEIANPNPVGSGARALGQGNAFIAIADDATAASWNPGGLPQLQDPEISLAFEAVTQSEMTNKGNAGDNDFDFQDFNYASIVYPWFYRKNMVFSLSFLKLYRFDRDYQLPFSNVDVLPDGRKLEIFGDYDFDQDGSFSVVSPAFGIHLTAKLQLGVTLNIWNHSVTGNSAFTTRERTFSAQDLDGTVTNFIPFVQENQYSVDRGYSFVIGALYRYSKEWSFGVVIKPDYKLELDHQQSFAEIINGAERIRPDLSGETDADLEFPWIIGIGTAWRPRDSTTLSADVTWSQWSEYRIRENGISRNPIDGTSKVLEDTFTVRCGGEYLLVLKESLISFRGGLGYDPAPGVGDVDEYFTINCGIGVQLRNRLNFDVAYEYRVGDDVNGDALSAFGISQDVRRHRTLASVIYYF